MPIYFTQIPIQKLISSNNNNNEYLLKTKEEELKDIQAIRMFKKNKNNGDINCIGSDIFMIEEAIKEKLAIYNEKESEIHQTNNTNNIEKLPNITPAYYRTIKKKYVDQLIESNESVYNSEIGVNSHINPTDEEYLTWAIKFASSDFRDLKRYLFNLENDILTAEIQLCGGSLSDKKIHIIEQRQKSEEKNKLTLIEKLEKYEAASQKRLLLMQRIGPLASISMKQPLSLSPKKSSVMMKGRNSLFSPRTKIALTPLKESPNLNNNNNNNNSNNNTMNTNSASTQPFKSLPSVNENDNLTTDVNPIIITQEQKEKHEIDVKKGLKKKKKSFFVTDNTSSKNLLSVDSSSSLGSDSSSFQITSIPDEPKLESNFEETKSITINITPHPPSKPKTQLQSSNPRRISSMKGVTSKTFEESPESDNLSPRSNITKLNSIGVSRRSSMEKCALVAEYFERHLTLEQTPDEDFGGLKDDINSDNDSPISQYEVHKNIKALRSSIQYSIGVHNTVNKTVVPLQNSIDPTLSTISQPIESPSKFKQPVKISQKHQEGSLDSIMHKEALNTIGLSKKELEEKKLLEKLEKQKLGIPSSDYFEKNRNNNANNLLKIVSEGKERRKKLVRNENSFRQMQCKKHEKGILQGQRRKLMKETLELHRKYEFHIEDSLACNSQLDYQESLSDFKHITHSISQLPNSYDDHYQSKKTFRSTKELLDVALEKSDESIHQHMYDSLTNVSQYSTMSTLSPRDGDIHFKKMKKKMIYVKKTVETQYFLKNRWFITIISEIKRTPEIPNYIFSFLSAIAHLFSVGKVLTPEIFYTIVESTLPSEAFQQLSIHEILSTIREHSNVTPPQLLEYLYKNGIQPSTSLLAQVKVYKKAPSRKKKLDALKKIVTATKKSTYKSLRRDIAARASLALNAEKSFKEREIVRVLSMGQPIPESLRPDSEEGTPDSAQSTRSKVSNEDNY